MPKALRRSSTLALDDALLPALKRKGIPHDFVLDAIASLAPTTRPMFGCFAVYVGDKIVFFLREKSTHPADNGVWLATSEEHHASLRPEFPHIRSIGLLGTKTTGWQVLPSDAADFEESAMHACELVLARDPRIGKVPQSKRSGSRPAKPAAKQSRR